MITLWLTNGIEKDHMIIIPRTCEHIFESEDYQSSSVCMCVNNKDLESKSCALTEQACMEPLSRKKYVNNQRHIID